ncbi:MAG: type II toxin-antitoxin system HicB family antitoxin [Clostridia bacterium]|jgi:predicted RNase H-like HicB family nuclease|nr:type II toxin-antitoxin system HicB family antitoxin [Clostridia bacterium]
MKLSYYAVLKNVPNGIVITFPDVPGCFTCAFDMGEVDKLAEEVLCLTFHGHRQEDVPAASEKESIETAENELLRLIEVEMDVEDGALKSRIPIDLL